MYTVYRVYRHPYFNVTKSFSFIPKGNIYSEIVCVEVWANGLTSPLGPVGDPTSHDLQWQYRPSVENNLLRQVQSTYSSFAMVFLTVQRYNEDFAFDLSHSCASDCTDLRDWQTVTGYKVSGIKQIRVTFNGARVSSNILQSLKGPLYFESSERTCMRADKPNFLSCRETSIEHQSIWEHLHRQSLYC
jgi:hypothetical protein